ncbi:hypothetical protein [Sphaerisporangium perillae]|uniref:hypothetical protein n=1 Tax=Sphaerisporangium perillae TaxID=2935860 RepID=UPI00201063BC|nr:hypothetical protein [Sphaerisporangium perillae]
MDGSKLHARDHFLPLKDGDIAGATTTGITAGQGLVRVSGPKERGATETRCAVYLDAGFPSGTRG